jgi:hypothetical protein
LSSGGSPSLLAAMAVPSDWASSHCCRRYCCPALGWAGLWSADPYLNVDAGTMSPFEHGEVFVLDDGGEVGAWVGGCACLWPVGWVCALYVVEMGGWCWG